MHASEREQRFKRVDSDIMLSPPPRPSSALHRTPSSAPAHHRTPNSVLRISAVPASSSGLCGSAPARLRRAVAEAVPEREKKHVTPMRRSTLELAALRALDRLAEPQPPAIQCSVSGLLRSRSRATITPHADETGARATARCGPPPERAMRAGRAGDKPARSQSLSRIETSRGPRFGIPRWEDDRVAQSPCTLERPRRRGAPAGAPTHAPMLTTFDGVAALKQQEAKRLELDPYRAFRRSPAALLPGWMVSGG